MYTTSTGDIQIELALYIQKSKTEVQKKKSINLKRKKMKHCFAFMLKLLLSSVLMMSSLVKQNARYSLSNNYSLNTIWSYFSYPTDSCKFNRLCTSRINWRTWENTYILPALKQKMHIMEVVNSISDTSSNTSGVYYQDSVSGKTWGTATRLFKGEKTGEKIRKSQTGKRACSHQ